MPPRPAVHRWDGIAVEKVTEMISRKVVTGGGQLLAQVYLKRGAHVPLHRHASEQMTYVLEGALRCRVGAEEFVVRAGEVLHVPAGRRHQAEALDDTFEIDVFSPVGEAEERRERPLSAPSRRGRGGPGPRGPRSASADAPSSSGSSGT